MSSIRFSASHNEYPVDRRSQTEDSAHGRVLQCNTDVVSGKAMTTVPSDLRSYVLYRTDDAALARLPISARRLRCSMVDEIRR